jgi:hypothetical protein
MTVKQGIADHSRSRWDETSTIWLSDGCESMESTFTHWLDGMRQARYGEETVMKAWNRRLLTI